MTTPECNTQAAVAMYLAGAEESGAWKRRVLDHLVVCNILSAEHENNPEKALTDLINWHVQVALDPLVSSDAAALAAKGAEDMRERAVPTGYVLVPKKPTTEMETAGRVKATAWQGRDIHTAIWYDMLAAAPACGFLPTTPDTSLLHDKCHVDIANARPAKSAKAITPANTEGEQ